MKVLVPEEFSKAGIAVLEDAGYAVTFKLDAVPSSCSCRYWSRELVGRAA